MNLLRLPSLFLVPALLASASLACGELTDPTQNSEKTATVSGALTGTSVPADAHVALVWRNGNAGGAVVGGDAAIVGGKFTMTLTPPPDGYFFSVQESDSMRGGGDTAVSEDAPSTPPSAGGSDPAPGSSPGGKIGTRTNVSGGISEPLSVATAGFVVYVDTNGNGKLDLEGEYASSPDKLLGGNKELLLTYFKGGGALDYEKLRDKSGILPAAGFNLAWIEGRWLALSLVELKISSNVTLPGPVCAGSGSGAGFVSGGDMGGIAPPGPGPSVEPPKDPDTTTPPPETGYPAASDPGVHCYDNGRSFYYTGNCPPPPPPPVGLCAGQSGGEATIACAGQSYSFAGDTPPADWPCTLTTDTPPPCCKP